MKKINTITKSIVIFLVLILVSYSVQTTQNSQDLAQQQLVEELRKAQEQLKQAQLQLEELNQNLKESDKTNEKPEKLSKEQKELLKEQEKAKKIQEKERKAQEKLLKQQQEQQQLLEKEQEAERIKELKIEAEQKILASQQICNGAFALETGECGTCSENCERCSSPLNCDICQPGFYRVIEDKKVKSHCSKSIPNGYLPQLNTFQKINPQLQLVVTETYEGQAIALDGKKTITKEAQGLPYTISKDGVPTVNGVPVRVDVAPCITHCQACPAGYVPIPQTKGCIKQEKCFFPQELVEENGKLVCNQNNPSVWKGQIKTELKEKHGQDPEIPSKKSLSLIALTNKQNEEDNFLFFSWQIFDSQQQEITSSVFVKGNLGRKIKADATAFVSGQVYHIKCLVKDISNEQTLNLETQYTH